MVRVQLSRYRARPAASRASTGSTIRATPTLSRTREPSRRPASTVAAPAVRNDVPRVVSPVSSEDRIPCLLPGWACSASNEPAAAAAPRSGQDLLGQVAADQRLRRGQQPVREHREGQGLDVVGDDEVAAVQGRVRLARPEQVQRRPGRRAEPQLRRVPGGVDQVDHVLPDLLRDVHRVHRRDQRPDVAGVGHRLEVVQRRGRPVRVQHRQLGGGVGVADGDPRGEAVALGLGQRVGALHLDRVLGRDDHERRLQRIGRRRRR